MPFYPGDYLADTRRLSLEHHGAYLLLILDYWRNGPPPSDDATLARIVGCTAAVWRRLAPVLRPLFRDEAGKMHHKRIDAELATATERSDKATAKAATAAAARWLKQSSSDAPSNASSITQAMHEQCPSPSPSPSSLREDKAAPKKSSKRKAKTGMPEGFAISERVSEWAIDKGHQHLAERFEHFVGKVRANGYTYVDWDDGFMGAIRDDWAGLNGRINGAGKSSKWWESESATKAKGDELGLRPRNGESWNDFRGRIRERIGA